jgi:endogenous inhibitor of DNA gyrase (YacG/DUF329 family)
MNDKVADLAERRARKPRAKARKCPICGKPASQAQRPFCSDRCRTIDLSRWLTETYRVPSEETPDPDGEKPSGDDE